MLKNINKLTPFFEDCYRRINVREYAKIVEVSPPTSSKILNHCFNEGLLLKDGYRNYILFYANKESKDFIDLSRMYWRHKLGEIISFLERELVNPTIILFGSLSKAEAKDDSDIDLAIFSHKRELNAEVFENKIKRKIQLFWFESTKAVKNKDLLNNIINGYVLTGKIEI